MEIVQILENQLKGKMENIAIFDKDLKLLESNIEEIDESISTDDIYVFEGRKCGFDINLCAEKNFLIRTKTKLVPVCFRPLFDYSTNTILGYEARKITLGELLGDRYVPRKFCTSVRRGLISISSNTDMLNAFLEDIEMYEGYQYLNGSIDGCVDVLSTIANSETVNSIFNSPLDNPPENASVLLEDIIQNCKRDFRDAMEFETYIAPNVWIEMDRSHFMSVVMNLIVNAYVYNNSEKKVAKVSLKTHDNNAVLTVTDNGIGINSVDADDINFNSSKEGLGLIIVNLLATILHGDFKIMSLQDYNGTTARLSVPMAECPSNVKSRKMPAENYRQNRFSQYGTLVAKAKLQKKG